MQRKLSKILSVVLAIAMLLSASVVFVGATEIIANGKCGDNLTWTLDSDGTLIISGTGEMWDPDESSIDENYKQSYYKHQFTIKNIVINEGVTNIPIYAFYYYFYELESVSIPSSVKAIGLGAFVHCPKLTNVTFSEGLTIIGESAFAGCTALSDVVLPDSLTHIGYQAFGGTGITSLNIPKNVNSIDGMTVLSVVFEGYTVDAQNQYFSADDEGNLFSKDKTKLVQHIFKVDEKEYSIPSSVNTIGCCAFAYNLFLETINIPDTVKSIEEGAFAKCVMLKELKLPRNLEKLSCSFLFGNANLYNLVIPENANIVCPEDTYFWGDHKELSENCYAYILSCRQDNDVSCIKELTVYDRDMDFTDVTIGFYSVPFRNEEVFDYYRPLQAKEYANLIYSRDLGGEEQPPVDFGITDEELVDYTREPDLVLEKYGTAYDLYKIPGFTVRCFKGSTAESYAKQYGFNIEYLCDSHVEQILPGYAASCYEDGLTDKIVCSECDEILAEHEVIPASHKNENGDGICDECGEMLVNCSHICHKTGFLGFFAKIAVFFWRLFGTNPVCECGMAHY